MQQKTYYPKAAEIQRDWVVLDAEGQNLGRFAARIAHILLGKHKPTFTPGVEMGDFVVVVNTEKVTVTGTKTSSKLTSKIYYGHSGYPGGLKAETARERLSKKPEHILTDAVWGMLPKGKLGRTIIKKLKVYRGSEHPHKAQKPEILSV